MTPAKPLPLVLPMTSTCWPASNSSTESSWPMTLESACRTVTGTRRLFSSQTWVMPSLVASRPLTWRVSEVDIVIFSPLQLDLDVHVRGEVEAHERVDGLGRGVNDVDKTLVRAHFTVLAAGLVLVRRPDNAVHVLLRGQRHGADYRCACARHRLNDLPS